MQFAEHLSLEFFKWPMTADPDERIHSWNVGSSCESLSNDLQYTYRTDLILTTLVCDDRYQTSEGCEFTVRKDVA